MPRPKKKGPLIPLRLSDEATEELFRRADGAGVTPREYLVAHIEGILSLTLDEPGLGPIPPPSQKLDASQFLEVAKFGKHPGWRLNLMNFNVCTACGQPKSETRPNDECLGNPL